MKPLLWLLAVLLLTGVLIYGALDSSAFPIDNSVQPGNVIYSGHSGLAIHGGPLNARNLAPGEAYTRMGSLCAQNKNSSDLKYRGWFKGASGGQILTHYTQMTVEKQLTSGWQVVKTIRGYPGVGGDRLFSYFEFPGFHPLAPLRSIVAGRLAPGQQDCYRFSARLAEVTPNAVQDQNLKFVLFFEANEIENTGR